MLAFGHACDLVENLGSAMVLALAQETSVLAGTQATGATVGIPTAGPVAVAPVAERPTMLVWRPPPVSEHALVS
jgi:hypothetical protein